MGITNIQRNSRNPIITINDVKPSMDGYEVIGVFNAAATKYKDNYLLLLRVAERPIQKNEDVFLCPIFNECTGEINILGLDRHSSKYDFSDPRVVKWSVFDRYLTSISHIRLAWSKDGTKFEITDTPLIKAYNKYTAFGVEDPRITKIQDTYYISFTGVSDNGIVNCMWSTKNFEDYQDHGVLFPPDNKDVSLFPEKIGGKYYILHRPSTSEYSAPNLWIASSDNLESWGDHRILAKIRPDSWESQRIGGGAAPIRTDKGWLEIYHGADKNNKYSLGLMLLDLEEPWKIVSRYELPILEPEEPYEKEGFFGNVVFTCGAILEDDIVHIYYGACDNSVCEASVKLEHLLELL